MPEESTSRELFPLSIVILTKNEEDHLQDCLESCQWAEDILVVDSGSRDRTVEIARSFGAYVIHQGWMGFGPQRRFAVSQAAHDWVLCIDADERLSPELSASIQSALSGRSSDAAPHVYEFARKTWLLGRFLKHGDGYPDWQIRLFDRRHAVWNNEPVEEKVETDIRPVRLKGDLLHYPSNNLSEFLQKKIRFAYLRAGYLHKIGDDHHGFKTFSSPLCRFVKFYFLKLGFLDGLPGFIHTACGCIYTFMKYARLVEIRLSGPGKKN